MYRNRKVWSQHKEQMSMETVTREAQVLDFTLGKTFKLAIRCMFKELMQMLPTYLKDI